MGKNEVLVGAINESLLSLGEPIMKTIVWHLNIRGVYLDERRDVDLKSFYAHLEYIVGDITEVILNEIYDRVRSRTPGHKAPKNQVPTVDTIEQMLRSHSGSLAQ